MKRETRAATLVGGDQNRDFTLAPAAEVVIARLASLLASVESDLIFAKSPTEDILHGGEVDFGDSRRNQTAEKLDSPLHFGGEIRRQRRLVALGLIPSLHNLRQVAEPLRARLHIQHHLTAKLGFAKCKLGTRFHLGLLQHPLEQVGDVGFGAAVNLAHRLAGFHDGVGEVGPLLRSLNFGESGVHHLGGNASCTLRHHALLVEEVAGEHRVLHLRRRRKLSGLGLAVGRHQDLAARCGHEVEPIAFFVAVRAVAGEQVEDACGPEEAHLLHALHRRGGRENCELGLANPSLGFLGARGGNVFAVVADFVSLVEDENIRFRGAKALHVVDVRVGHEIHGGVVGDGELVEVGGILFFRRPEAFGQRENLTVFAKHHRLEEVPVRAQFSKTTLDGVAADGAETPADAAEGSDCAVHHLKAQALAAKAVNGFFQREFFDVGFRRGIHGFLQGFRSFRVAAQPRIHNLLPLFGGGSADEFLEAARALQVVGHLPAVLFCQRLAAGDEDNLAAHAKTAHLGDESAKNEGLASAGSGSQEEHGLAVLLRLSHQGNVVNLVH